MTRKENIFVPRNYEHETPTLLPLCFLFLCLSLRRSVNECERFTNTVFFVFLFCSIPRLRSGSRAYCTPARFRFHAGFLVLLVFVFQAVVVYLLTHLLLCFLLSLFSVYIVKQLMHTHLIGNLIINE